MIRKFVNTAICFAEDFVDRVLVLHRRKVQIDKFQDTRRKAIWQSVKLTNIQKKEIDDFFLENYGEKVPYTWHRHYTAFRGTFDKAFFPELIYIPELTT